MWELDHKKGWGQKNWCFQIVVLEKTLESPLDVKKIKVVNPKGNQSWKSLKVLMLQYFLATDATGWLIEKDLDAGKDRGQEVKGVIEDKIVKWYHWLNAHELEQTLGRSGGQGIPVCCSSCGFWVRHNLVTEQQQPLNISTKSEISIFPQNLNIIFLFIFSFC